METKEILKCKDDEVIQNVFAVNSKNCTYIIVVTDEKVTAINLDKEV